MPVCLKAPHVGERARSRTAEAAAGTSRSPGGLSGIGVPACLPLMPNHPPPIRSLAGKQARQFAGLLIASLACWSAVSSSSVNLWRLAFRTAAGTQVSWTRNHSTPPHLCSELVSLCNVYGCVCIILSHLCYCVPLASFFLRAATDHIAGELVARKGTGKRITQEGSLTA